MKAKETRELLSQKAKNYLIHLPLSILANIYYRFPSYKLKIIGITGTDGKTTTATLLFHILKSAGFPVGLISTVSAKIEEETIDTGFHVTSPDPWLLQKLLRRMVNRGIKYVVLEVTSHGLDQFRVFGINYEVGIITNITREHLDYHKTFENYRKAKLKLLENSKIAILNKDDDSFSYLFSRLEAKKIPTVSYGIKNNADFTADTFPFKTKLVGDFNKLNCLAAIAASVNLGISEEKIRKAVSDFDGVEGRMEEIKEGQNFKVIVDFAHTPNALEQTLKTLKQKLTENAKLIVVFGAAGLRDVGKRPLMGEIAGKYADLVILTAEDPRTEKVENICRQIALGCKKVRSQPTIIYDRGKAIEFAIRKAKKDDIVVICGKGHEKSMCFGKKEFPWSDQEASRKILRKLLKD